MKIHLTGVGGVGMAGLAVLLKRRGHAVSGCDIHASARTRWLESLGIPVAIGHDSKHVEDQDLVIVTPAVAKDNLEYVAAIGRGYCLRRGEVLAKLVSDAPDSIAVCGSHGKTTTATFIAKLLIALGESVEWAIGGETGDFPVAGGKGGVLVVEADESDGTLAEYTAKTLVVTNCEYDHPDRFKTRAEYVACYDAARAKAGEVVEGRARDERRETRAETRDQRPETSCLASHVSCPQLESILASLAPHNRQNALLAVEVARRRGHSLEAIAAALPAVVAQLPDRRFQRVWPMGEGVRHETRDASLGEDEGVRHETRDASLGEDEGVRHETRDASLGEDEGVRHETRDASGDLRRETIDGVSRLTSDSSCLSSRVSCPHPLVYTDYAHHPTEMACAIQMARAAATGRVIVLFQPHRYSRTKALKGEFPAAFAGADEVVLCPTYAAFEKPVEGGDIADLYAACRSWCSSENCTHGEMSRISEKCAHGESAASPRFFLARSCAEAWEHARNTMKPGDLTLLLGAGDIIDLVPQIREEMGRTAVDAMVSIASGSGSECPSRRDWDNRVHEKRRIWIGAGSNTWKSDLNLDVEYVKTQGPAGRLGASLLADPAIGPRIPWMAGIPGTVGGWVKMNAGAFGHSISEVIESVKIDGRWVPASACGFSYRHSDIVGEIQDVRWESGKVEGWGSGEVGNAAYYLARRKKFPPGTKGSVFKNPPGDFAGRLLEAAGVKGLAVGGAYVWSEHANVIVAGPDATASDFLALARLMALRVFFRFGIRLEPEIAGLAAVHPAGLQPPYVCHAAVRK